MRILILIFILLQLMGCNRQERIETSLADGRIDSLLNNINKRQNRILSQNPSEVISFEANGTKEDVNEVDKNINIIIKNNEKLNDENIKLKDDTNKKYRATLNWFKLISVIGFASTPFLFIWVDKKLAIAVCITSISLYLALKVEIFLNDYGIYIILGLMSIFILYICYLLFIKKKALNEIITNVETIIKPKLNNLDEWQAIKGQIKQSKSTQKLVRQITSKINKEN